MADQSRRDRVGLGLIGLGSQWESVYRETLLRLKNRLTIRLVYDSVEARAKSAAAEFDAEVAGSLRQMLARPTLQGLLLLDPGWLGTGALCQIAHSGKPVYLAGPALRQISTLQLFFTSQDVSEIRSNCDSLWIPEFGLRFTPATCRLRELIATKLGRVEQIQIECRLISTTQTADVAHLIDWCANLMGQIPTHSKMTVVEPPSTRRIELEFPASSFSPKRRTATLRQAVELDSQVRFSVSCEKGKAVMTDRCQITWESATKSANESLVDERSETEILIDQFCRRAVGGLNPVGRLSEYLCAFRIAESLEHCD